MLSMDKKIKCFHPKWVVPIVISLILPINNLLAQSPIITSFSPQNACFDKATTIQIIGKNLAGTKTVLFGSKPATFFSVNSDTSITAITPSRASTGVITIITINGNGSSSNNFGIINEKIVNTDTTIQQGDSINLRVEHDYFTKYDTLDFSEQFNFNNTVNYYEYSNIPTGNQVFDNVPFYIYPFHSEFNGWNANYVKRKNPIVLTLNTKGKLISAINLLANTYWGKLGSDFNTVQFWSSGKLIYQKDLIGGQDIRDYHGNPYFVNSINNTTTTNVWIKTIRKGTTILRLDKIRIELPKASNVDKVLIIDNGKLKESRIFVLAATIENTNPGESTILWSTGSSDNTILVAPTKTTTYYATLANGTNTCLDSVTITVPKPIVFTDTAHIILTATAIESKRIAVKWSVSNANYVTSYTVQHSIDGTHYTDVSTVPPSTSNNFSYIEVNANEGVNYYRIKASYNHTVFSYSNNVSFMQ